MNEIAAERVAEAPESIQGILTRCYNGKCSPRAAIKAFCLQCVGYNRQDVTNCTALGCPLHQYRPFQVKG